MEMIEVGQMLPTLTKGPISRQMLVEWCAAENDYYNLHYDERVAERMQLPGTPIQGTFKYALMGQLLQHWLAGKGTLRKISATYRGLDLEGETLSACGKVIKIEKTKDGNLLQLDLWVENSKGDRSTIGQATAFFPNS